jgi:hypothetical protein
MRVEARCFLDPGQSSEALSTRIIASEELFFPEEYRRI